MKTMKASIIMAIATTVVLTSATAASSGNTFGVTVTVPFDFSRIKERGSVAFSYTNEADVETNTYVDASVTTIDNSVSDLRSTYNNNSTYSNSTTTSTSSNTTVNNNVNNTTNSTVNNSSTVNNQTSVTNTSSTNNNTQNVSGSARSYIYN